MTSPGPPRPGDGAGPRPEDGAEPPRAEDGARPPRPSFILPLAVFALALGILLLSGDLGDLWAAMGSFRAGYLPVILALSMVNYGLRLVRWNMYLRLVGASIDASASATIFASGLAMSVTPGKAGELVKAYGVQRLGAAPVRRIVPVILMERVSDAAGVLLLATLGASNLLPLLVVGGGLAAFHGLLLWPRPARALHEALSRRPRLAAPAAKAWDAFSSLSATARPLPLLSATALSVVAWGAEGVGLALTVRGLGAEIGMRDAVMIYAIATLAGALSFIPGGLLVTEGSMAALLVAKGLSGPQAAIATTICRVATLWFAVGLGCAALFWAWPALMARRERAVVA